MVTIYETLIDRIAAVLGGIDDIGQIHKEEYWTADKEIFKSTHVVDIGGADQVRAWWITRAGIASEAMTAKTQQEDYTFELRAFIGLNQSEHTERTFKILTETVKDTFNALRPDLGIPATVKAQSPMNIEETVRHSNVGAILCHYAVLRLSLTIFTRGG